MKSKISRRQFIQLSIHSLLGLGLSGCEWAGIPELLMQDRLPIPAPESPNIIFIVLDTVRAKSLSLYGYERPTTPNLERFAQNGVIFDRAIAPAPWTLPSHATMFTGRWQHEHMADFSAPLGNFFPTIAEVFSSLGYLTAGFVANTGYCSYESGLQRGFIHYEDYALNPETILLSSSVPRRLVGDENIRAYTGFHELIGRKKAEEINSHFLSWLSQVRERPFFAFLNYFDAHTPYLPPKPFDEQFGARLKRGDDRVPKWDWTQENVQAEVNAYDGAIAYLDHELGKLIDQLNTRQILDNTLVIITSDHGEQIGERNLFDHTNSLYIQTLRVPLVIWYPSKIPQNTRVAQAVSLRDLPRTIFNILGLEGDMAIPGNTLSQYWQNAHSSQPNIRTEILSELSKPNVLEDWFPIARGNMKSIVNDQFHYIRMGDGSEELYNLDEDPDETNNLALQLKDTVLAELRKSLESLLNQG